MTINSAVSKAKSSYTWSIVPHEPTTVSVRYKTKDGTLQETEFDLYADDPEAAAGAFCREICLLRGKTIGHTVSAISAGFSQQHR